MGAAVCRRALRRAAICTLAALFLAGANSAPIPRPDSRQPSDHLVITPTSQGRFGVPAPDGADGIVLEIGYASVNSTARLALVSGAGGRWALEAADSGGPALTRFEQPIIAHLPDGEQVVMGWPGPLALPDASARWIIVFDAHGIYALPADAPAPDSIIYLGPLEHYTPALIEHGSLPGGATLALAPRPRVRLVLRSDPTTGITRALPTAAHAARYHDRFLPEDLGNPGGLMLLGWAWADDLPDLVRALRATIPADPDLPAPGVPRAPLQLILPFDCSAEWAVSWGYHHSTPQNRFAVDFATLASDAGGQPVYAAHAGTLALKRYGSTDHMIDVGFAARVTAADGITATVYGHLEPQATLAWWGLAPESLPDFEWVEVGPVAQGQRIGTVGRAGYATGPHIHFALWSWDQSLYQPVPIGPLREFWRGLAIPAGLRNNCGQYTN